jgi:hypothetical protein
MAICDVFLSYNEIDQDVVDELARRLVKQGIQPWLDTWNLIPGDLWQEEVEEALRSCDSCAVLIGPTGIGPWQNAQMRAAIERRIREGNQQYRVIPVLLPGAERGERAQWPEFLMTTTSVEFRDSLDDEVAIYRLICGIRGVEPIPSPNRTLYKVLNPYRGLQVFDVADAPFYFGREVLVEWVMHALQQKTAGGPVNRFLSILGASGSGKSSLARAGVIAAIRQGRLEASEDWICVLLKPGANPLESLAIALANQTTLGRDLLSAQNIIQDLKADEQGLHSLTSRLLSDAPSEQQVVLLIDQLEELFTVCRDEEQRHTFISNLLYAARIPDGRTLILTTLRGDFYGRCAAYPALAATLSKHQVLVSPMSRSELQQAIERPVHLVGGEFEPGLVEVLLDDVQNQPGSLPLMQYTLRELWNQRTGMRLTHEAYHALGGITNSLEQRAEDMFTSFNADEQRVCRQIFRRLVQIVEGAEDTGRRVTRRELGAQEISRELLDAVLNKLAHPEVRLITIHGVNEENVSEHTEVDDQQLIELAHEALITSWNRLRNWIETDRSNLRARQQITEAASLWEVNDYDTSYLYRGAQLIRFHGFLRTDDDMLNDRERKFLTASVKAQEVEQSISRRRAQWTLTLLISALVVTTAFAGLAVKFWRDAASFERDYHARLFEAEGRELFQRRPLLGLRLILEGLVLVPDDETETRTTIMRSIAQLIAKGRIAELGTDIIDSTVSPDHTALIVARRDAPAELRRINDGTLVAQLSGQLVATDFSTIHFSSKGAFFFVHYLNDHAEIRRTHDGAIIASFSHNVSLGEIAFGPEEDVFVVLYGDVPAELRHLVNGSLIANIGDKPASDVLFNRDGSVFAVSYAELFLNDQGDVVSQVGGTVPTEVRRTFDGSLLTPAASTNQENDVTFSPDGKIFLVSYLEAPTEVHLTENGSLVDTLKEHLGSSFSMDFERRIEFSPKGSAFVVKYEHSFSELHWTDSKNIVQLSGRITSLGREYYSQSGISFTPDGNSVIISYDNLHSELRRIADGKLIARFKGVVLNDDFSPQGTAFIVRSQFIGGVPVEIQHTTSGASIHTFEEGISAVGAVFSPKDNFFVVEYEYSERPCELRRLDNGTLVGLLSANITPPFIYYNDLIARFPEPKPRTASVFSPQEDFLLIDYKNGSVELFSTANGRKIETFKGSFDDYFFNGHHNSFLLNYADRSGELRNSDDGSLITSLPGKVVNALLSPDQKFMIIKYRNSAVELWDVQETPYRLVVLAPDLLQVTYTPEEQRALVQYPTGVLDLIDLTWLQDIQGVSRTSSEEKMLNIACHVLLQSGLWTSKDYQELEIYLNGNSPQACSHTP